jgi:hypothetical protein
MVKRKIFTYHYFLNNISVNHLFELSKYIIYQQSFCDSYGTFILLHTFWAKGT